jgi:hypothetical protein
VPLAFEYKATITENVENATVSVPVEVSCKLLEGDERAWPCGTQSSLCRR